MANKLCAKCGKMMDEDTKFYTYKDGSKTEMCKSCLTMHIDNFDESTFLWLLEKMDVPYIATEWNVLRDRAFAKNKNLNGMSVFGKYLSKMKLKQWIKYKWSDTEVLNKQIIEKNMITDEERKAFDAELKKQLENGEITEAEYKTLASPQTQYEEYESSPIQVPTFSQDEDFDKNESIIKNVMDSAVADLTEEDKIYLAMKWGALYKVTEWIELEKKYTEMTNSFDVQDADTIETLILLCKTNLKMNQALDSNDVEGYQKLSKVSESLRKSAKFTAAQNKEEKSNYVDSVGELVALCEKEGFIERYVTDVSQDKVDLTLKDMNNYLNKLVTQDLGFGQQIEDALKKIQLQKEAQMAETSEKDLFDEETEELTDENLAEFYNEIEKQKDLDNENEVQ